jgi:hypothetical protein
LPEDMPFQKNKTNYQSKQHHAADKPGQRVRLVDIIYDLESIHEVINRNKIEPAFKFVPESKFRKKRKQDDKHHYEKKGIGYNAIGAGIIPALW